MKGKKVPGEEEEKEKEKKGGKKIPIPWAPLFRGRLLQYFYFIFITSKNI